MTQTASNKKYAGQKVAFLLNGGGPTDSLTLGGKGAGLVRLASLGIPVPAAFTISTSVARAYAQHGTTPRRLSHQMQWGIRGPGEGFRQALRRPKRPAYGLGAIRCLRLHGRHDGHRAQPRSQPHQCGGAG